MSADATTHYALMSRCCDQCLTTPQRIVPGGRAAQIVRDCRAAAIKFECHKASIVGQRIACRGVHEIAPCQAFRFAKAVGVPVVEYDPITLQPAQVQL